MIMLNMITGLFSGGTSILFSIGIYAAVFLLALGIGVFAGMRLDAYQTEKAALEASKAVVSTIGKQDAATSAVEAKDADQQVKIVTNTITVVKRVPVYVKVDKAKACPTVPAGFVAIHDAAALSAEPKPMTEDQAAQPSNKTLQDVANTVVENYGSCNAAIQKLTDLQEWVKSQQAITNGDN